MNSTQTRRATKTSRFFAPPLPRPLSRCVLRFTVILFTLILYTISWGVLRCHPARQAKRTKNERRCGL